MVAAEIAQEYPKQIPVTLVTDALYPSRIDCFQ